MKALKSLIGEIHRRSLWQVLGIYLVSAWIVYEVTQALVEGLRLPEWLPGLAVILLLIGLPVVLATAFVQEGGPSLRRSDPTLIPSTEVQGAVPAAGPEGRGARRLLTWQNAIMDGVFAFSSR